MNVKSRLRPQDFHLVLNLKTLKIKLFEASGKLRWMSDAVRDRTVITREPEPTTGELVLTESKNPNYINASPLPGCKDGFCDYAFIWENYPIPDSSLDQFRQFPGVFLRLKGDQFNELKLFAQHVSSRVSRQDRAVLIQACSTPVVYFSAG